MPANNSSIPNFEIEQQLMSQWCWAAVAVSIRRCYDNQFLLTQPEFASQMLGIPACNGGFFSDCDQRFSLQVALEALDIFEEKLEEPCKPGQIVEEIAAGRLIGCQLVQNSFDGHYIVIKGATGSGNSLRLEIADPLDGDIRFLTLRELLFEYRESQWEQTFFTRIPS